jgi:hypothetical protein
MQAPSGSRGRHPGRAVIFANRGPHGPSRSIHHQPPTAHGNASLPPPNISVPSASVTLISEAAQPHQPLIRMASIPNVLWGQQWVAPVFPEHQTIPLAELRSTAFREATEGCDMEKFELRGSDVCEIVKAFSNILGEAAKSGDFTSVLSPQHDFVM